MLSPKVKSLENHRVSFAHAEPTQLLRLLITCQEGVCEVGALGVGSTRGQRPRYLLLALVILPGGDLMLSKVEGLNLYGVM